MARGSTAVAKKDEKQQGLVPAALAEMFAQDAGAGLDGMTREDLAIPFIGVVQSLSPQRKRNDPKYIEGAQEGMLFNTVTNTLYDAEGAGVRVIPCGYVKKFIEWVPRDLGGGFVAEYASKQDALEQAQPGNQITDVAEHYVLIEGPDGAFTAALLSMKSSQLKVSRNWNSRQQMLRIPVGDQKINPPIYGTIYRLFTVEESNEKGTWHNFRVEYEGLVQDAALYAEAKAFHEVAKAAATRESGYGKLVETETPVEAPAGGDGNPTF